MHEDHSTDVDLDEYQPLFASENREERLLTSRLPNATRKGSVITLGSDLRLSPWVTV